MVATELIVLSLPNKAVHGGLPCRNCNTKYRQSKTAKQIIKVFPISTCYSEAAFLQRNNLSFFCFLLRPFMGAVIPIQKFSEQPAFRFLSVFYSVLDPGIRAKIIGLSFECDLCCPFLISGVPIHARVSAGIGCDDPVGFQHRH